MPAARPLLLVVDDEPDVLHSLHDLFRMDYRVLTYTRPLDALRALEELDVPVVMSDQRMPEMSGVEFLRRVKDLRPETTRLLFTGYADIKAVIDAINQGNVFRYITKPWDVEELATIIRQAMERHELVVERRRLIDELQATNARLAEANRLKTAFIEVASHELNTPVAVVLGLAELWRMNRGDQAPPAELAWIDRIQGAGRRLAATVERMLKLLRAGTFDDTLDLRSVELEPLLRGVISDLEPFLQARHQELDSRIHPALGSADVDPAKLGDILTNLIINAIKFTPDEGLIRIEAGPEGPERVRFRVIDRGIGIDADERRHLFEPFFTGYDTRHHSSGEYQFCKRGMGLGLCLVKTFVELHGGWVEVASAPSQGTIVEVVLPRHPPAQAVRARAVG